MPLSHWRVHFAINRLGKVSLERVNDGFDDWSALAGVWLAALAFWGFVVFLVLVVGISAFSYYDAHAAKIVAWISGALGAVLVLICAMGASHSYVEPIEWLGASTTFYYLATTCILHLRLCYLLDRA
jgi:hypothetical protein